MRATATEYRLRALILGGIFAAGFLCARFDHVALAEAFHVPARALAWAGGVTALAAAWLRTWGTAYLSKDVVHDAVLRTERVVADGPYRYVRNPLYLALVLLALAYATVATRLGAVVMVSGVTVFLLRLIASEEAALRASQGEDYEAFVRAVPRLFPAPSPRVPSSGRRGDWRRAWMGEEMFWAFALGLVAHAALGGWTVAAVLGAVGVALRVVERMRARRATSS